MYNKAFAKNVAEFFRRVEHLLKVSGRYMVNQRRSKFILRATGGGGGGIISGSKLTWIQVSRYGDLLVEIAIFTPSHSAPSIGVSPFEFVEIFCRSWWQSPRT